MTDLVNHPVHYSASRFGCECIDIVRHMTFDAGNAFKYIWRHADKGTPVQDLRKAVWYLNDLDIEDRADQVWINPRHRGLGMAMFLEHVAPVIAASDGVLFPYRGLGWIVQRWIDRAVLAVENRIADFCDCCDGTGEVAHRLAPSKIRRRCPECEGSGLRVDQDRNMR